MAGVKQWTFVDSIIAGAIDSIAKARKWSNSQTIAELLRESPTLAKELEAHGWDPVTLERKPLERKPDAPTS